MTDLYIIVVLLEENVHCDIMDKTKVTCINTLPDTLFPVKIPIPIQRASNITFLCFVIICFYSCITTRILRFTYSSVFLFLRFKGALKIVEMQVKILKAKEKKAIDTYSNSCIWQSFGKHRKVQYLKFCFHNHSSFLVLATSHCTQGMFGEYLILSNWKEFSQ